MADIKKEQPQKGDFRVELAKIRDMEELPVIKSKRSGLTALQKYHRDVTPEEENHKRRRLAILTEMAKTAEKDNTLLTSIVVGTPPKIIQGQQTVCISMQLNAENPDVLVLIPFERTFMDTPEINPRSDAPEDIIAAKKFVLRQMLGAEVTYMPRAVFEDAKKGITYVIGDRTKALSIERSIYYGGSTPKITENKLYKAKVISVYPNRVTLWLGGFEQEVPIQRLTNKYCPSAESLYQPGDDVPVFVNNIHFEKGLMKSADFDCISAEISTAVINTRFIVPGEQTFATISKIVSYQDEETGEIKHRLVGWCDAFHLPVRFTKIPINRHGIPIDIGDKVIYNVTAVADDGYVTGRITRIIKQTR